MRYYNVWYSRDVASSLITQDTGVFSLERGRRALAGLSGWPGPRVFMQVGECLACRKPGVWSLGMWLRWSHDVNGQVTVSAFLK